MLHGEKRRGSPGGVTDLRVDVLDMMLGGAPGDHQPLGDLRVREAAGKQPQHLDFAVAETGGPLTAYPRPLLPGGGDDCSDAVGVETTCGCRGDEVLCGLFG